MTHSQRILVNLSAQYIRTIINVCLSLYSTRLILAALGQTDFGIYSVVAGVVALLSFLTNALVISTQRFLSYHYGENNYKTISTIFNNSFWLHLLIGLILSIGLAIITRWVTHSFLNIDENRITAATIVYISSIIMLFISFITAPFRALFIARENIVYISFVDVMDGMLKVLIAVWLNYIAWDKLIFYGWGMVSMQVLNILAFGIYARCRFPESSCLSIKNLDKTYIREFSKFLNWTVYSSACIIIRTQGVAVVINKAFGAIANAAYGLTQQISGAVTVIVASVLNAMNPQLMKAEGQGNRQKMIHIAALESKCAFLLMMVVCTPLIVEMPAILHLWLGEFPPYTIAFTRLILFTTVCDQLTIGLNSANQATGDIKSYSLIINSTRLLTIPAAIICVLLGFSANSILVCYVVIDILCGVMRIPYMYKTINLNVHHYLKQVLWPVIFPTAISIIVCLLIKNYTYIEYRFILTLGVSIIITLCSIWFIALNSTERNLLKSFCHSFKLGK